MNKETLESIHGHELAVLAMKTVWGFDDQPPKPTAEHGGIPINGTWSFRTMHRARFVYAEAAKANGMKGLVQPTISFDSQVVYFDDGTEILTWVGDFYEAHLHHAIILVSLTRGEWE
ncbi:hypothetical protein OAU50_07675 [Planctomycetota bacterium]|nr:hypothetical protein [Planctomycetota bacterium]